MMRLAFTVRCEDGTAVITMNCGHGVYRSRTMPPALLHALAQLCDEMRQKASEVLPPGVPVPAYPRYLPLMTASIGGACDLTLGVHRLESGTIEQIIAVYDEGDQTAPVLVLAGEQIEEFIRQATAE